VSKFTI